MPDLPTGTVTFLFTDIEGSTRLLQQQGERYGHLLAEHRHVVRSVFAAHGVQEVDMASCRVREPMGGTPSKYPAGCPTAASRAYAHYGRLMTAEVA